MIRTVTLIAFGLSAAIAAGAADAPGPRLVFSKDFPGSKPAFVLIQLERDGKGVYKEAEDDEQPIKFRLQAAEADEVFALADKLDRFKRPLESGLKVANMGAKTFRYEGDGAPTETKFNYSTDVDAQALLEWFERINESANRYAELDRRVRYDRLGVNQTLLQLETAYDKGRLVGLDQFLPLLDRVVKNDSYLNMARERAAKLAEAFRAGQPAKPKAE